MMGQVAHEPSNDARYEAGDVNARPMDLSPKKDHARGRSHSRSPRRHRSRSRSRSPRRYRSRSRSPRRYDRSPRRYRSRSPRRDYGSSRPRFDRGGPHNRPKADPSNVLGVFGLNLRTNEEDLERIYGKYGKIEKVTVVFDRRINQSRGFGFVYFDTVEAADEARQATNGMELDGRSIRVDFSTTQKPHESTPGFYAGKRTRSRSRRFSRDRGGRSRSRSRSRDDRRSRRYSP